MIRKWINRNKGKGERLEFCDTDIVRNLEEKSWGLKVQ